MCRCYSEVPYLRIKDIADIKGARENQIFGLGYVAGLNGTGDKENADISLSALSDMLDKLGIEKSILNQLGGSSTKVNFKNMAAVIVTAQVSPFLQEGDKIDVVVASIGDCKSLAGGRLLLTPLQGANGEIYALAQGAITIGVNSSGNIIGGKQSKGIIYPNVGNISGGAILERDIPTTMIKDKSLTLVLHKPDFFTAGQIVDEINNNFPDCANVNDNSCVITVKIPEFYEGKVFRFIGEIEQLKVSCDSIARVVINEKTGTVIMGEQVKISKVVIAHGALTLEIMDKNIENKNNADRKNSIDESKEKNIRVIEMEQAVTVGQVAKGLNALGTSPNDIVAIFQALHRAGALQAKLEFM